jgi:uncharacterized protein (DUF433 family)
MAKPEPAVNRITLDPEQCGGRPCIRGMRICVVDVLDLLANGLTPQQVLDELPDLEIEDVPACIAYAAAESREAPSAVEHLIRRALHARREDCLAFLDAFPNGPPRGTDEPL